MFRISSRECTGCTACYSACPVDAIAMKPNSEGFLYPSIDKERCISCSKCKAVCPLNTKKEDACAPVECLVAQSTTDDVLDECASGGFIDVLCEYFTKTLHGWVAGVIFDEFFMPVHRIINTYNEAKLFRNSKYAQSDLGDSFRKIRDLIRSNEKVMFIGTPCQVYGLKSFLQCDYDNLITVDLVCRSIPSPALWKKYLMWQEKKHGSRIESVFCRKKTYGYHSGALEIRFKNGKRYCGSNRVDYYMKSFHSDVCSRLSCYDCLFKTENRVSDFTVFDSWSPEQIVTEPFCDNDRGYSNVVVRTQKAMDIVKHLHDVAIYRADSAKIYNFAGGMERHSIPKNANRAFFYGDLNELGFEKTVKKYIRVTPIDRLIESVKPYRNMVKELARRIKKSI